MYVGLSNGERRLATKRHEKSQKRILKFLRRLRLFVAILVDPFSNSVWAVILNLGIWVLVRICGTGLWAPDRRLARRERQQAAAFHGFRPENVESGKVVIRVGLKFRGRRGVRFADDEKRVRSKRSKEWQLGRRLLILGVISGHESGVGRKEQLKGVVFWRVSMRFA